MILRSQMVTTNSIPAPAEINERRYEYEPHLDKTAVQPESFEILESLVVTAQPNLNLT